MSTLRRERLARQAGLLLSGAPPPDRLEAPSPLVDLLLHHRLGALASYRISSSSPWRGRLPLEQTQRLDARVLETRMHHLMALHVLADVVAALEDVRFVLVKGLAIARTYPSPALRSTGDIDIVAAPGHFLPAGRKLEEAGWRELPTVHAHLDPLRKERYGLARLFRHPSRPVTLDLHSAVVDRTEIVPLPAEVLFETTRLVRLDDAVQVSVPGNEEHLALVALHAVRHGSFRLQWHYDVHQACQAWEGELDPVRFSRLCRRWKVRRAVRTAFESARQLYGTQRHPLDQERLDSWTRKAAARRSPGVVARGHLVDPGPWRRIASLLDLAESPGQAVGYMARLLAPPPSLVLLRPQSRGWPAAYLHHRIRALGGWLARLWRPS